MGLKMLILIFVLSLLPSYLIYRFLRNRKVEDKEYKRICFSALKRGMFLSVALTMVVSSLFYIVERILVALGASTIAITVYHNFILFALAEELVKYYVLKNILKKNPYPYDSLDIVSLMMIVGMGFGITEAIVYAIGANAGMMLVRGFTAMHCGYGFIMGYYIAKGIETKKKKYTILGIIIPFILHGSYDTCLSEVIWEVNENFMYVSLLLAVVAIITLIVAILYIRKANKK